MVVETKIEDKGTYLRINARGVRKGYEEVITGAKSVYNAAQNYEKQYVLIDCSELRYTNVSPPDAFNLVRYYEQELGEFKNVVISTIGKEENLEIMKFWESICQRRGFRFGVFPNEQRAQEWLDEQIELDMSKGQYPS